MAKKNALGRGLDVLISSDSNNLNNLKKDANLIDINLISSNPYQPRTYFDQEKLNELAASIKELGVVQPITVKIIENNKFQLIAGERRLRASKIAGLHKIPAYIRTANDKELLEIALVENIQREDLDPIEIAISYQRLMNECTLNQEELSKRIGKKRSTISNYIRLLNLPAKIQIGIRENKIGMGHARALLSISDDKTKLMIYNQIVKYDFSVRKVEEIVKEFNNDETIISKNIKKQIPKNIKEYKSLEKHLSDYFSTNVNFKRNEKGAGKIVIPFKNDEELEKIIAILDKMNT